MTFYEKSIIYKLKHNEDYDDTNIYIGSTSNLKNRKYKHKCSCNNEKDRAHNRFLYQFIRDNGGWQEWVMIPIEEYHCNSKNELEIRERYHIDLLRPTLNKIIPTRSRQEWYEDNKEKMTENKKVYRDANKEKMTKYQKEYRETNKELLKEKAKEYYEANKENISDKNKEYQKSNKEKISITKKVKILCSYCGCEVRKDVLKRHQKTQKCQNLKTD